MKIIKICLVVAMAVAFILSLGIYPLSSIPAYLVVTTQYFLAFLSLFLALRKHSFTGWLYTVRALTVLALLVLNFILANLNYKDISMNSVYRTIPENMFFVLMVVSIVFNLLFFFELIKESLQTKHTNTGA